MVDNVAASASRRSLPYSTLIRVGLVLIYLIALGVSAFVVFQRVREQVSESDLLPDFTLNKPETGESPNVEREGEAIPVWTATDRVTVLILGIDQRMQEEDDFGERTR